MISALQGTIYQKDLNLLIIMAGGVGYGVNVPEKVTGALSVNQTVFLFIHTHVRDTAIELYGFLEKEELSLFELLLDVSGIGPRTALLISNRGVEEIKKAIRTADVDFFTSIPRLGKKNAQKIIIELKTKLGSLEDLDLQRESDGETKELTDALTEMGFAKTEILSAVKHLTEDDKTVEQKLRHALKLLAKSNL